MKTFEQRLKLIGMESLQSERIATLQVNVGKLCNQACLHCHVEAGPLRTEIMTRETIEAVLRVLESHDIPNLDITGGAPEMNPHFDYLVEQAAAIGRHVMVRSNLTVYFEEGRQYLPEFFRQHEVEVIASLPCYLKENVDSQRGTGIFDKSIRALRWLNAVGYGKPNAGLVLNLVYNPVGTYLPPRQEGLEVDYKRELGDRYGISFTNLFVITNVPIGRFLHDLVRSGAYETYLQKLRDAFNSATVDSLMCRNLISVGWDGTLFDCDFNQMLNLSVNHGAPTTIFDFDMSQLSRRRICTGEHCYACTAGAGSSCKGVLTS
ncbi:MAG: radical SAM protein [Armatimonadetes bacterium CG2_30_59_28]|nr:radical SAM/Cys-rich domain protein [Armatimonadota bacterium]OIO90197.1 MAG: radical SAM protein [Armatimonadetes bacterium CG2_30_59_28]PIU61430.1 MAG: radical SAM protein [Armatimonadetes bacterium CG07_land_8_20_14_0_80_59_28]PIX42853.1 MAG: radical SAM protein [Armatimonadetes bacterium CG_4_8_14_3_um_filter_58_9]PIY40698.1 MAG: radical SAM protein [Armatimonadetes bacterium CG_4_10_14_3_um_filter_59_10]PJB63492.1 MAG: radical SAM protein [Armatimonadetes bacterium CG_4_9_14_3_um_filte